MQSWKYISEFLNKILCEYYLALYALDITSYINNSAKSSINGKLLI
jgi:hypothetical protein